MQRITFASMPEEIMLDVAVEAHPSELFYGDLELCGTNLALTKA